MRRSRLFLSLGLLLALALALAWWNHRPAWSEAELALLHSLSLASLPPLPADPSNAVANDPAAAALGASIFFDTRFSSDGAVACATCHQPGLFFADGLPLSRGVGEIPLNAMTLVGAAYNTYFTWNGKNDSQWAQALIPLENPVEHDGDRMGLVHLLAAYYREPYEALFGPLPDLSDSRRFPPHASPAGAGATLDAWYGMAAKDRDAVNRTFANLGKTLAAYQRTLLPAPARFDAYVAAVEQNDRAAQRAIFSEDEEAGLRLFLGKGKCIDCHNGPRFTNDDFHNTAIPGIPGVPLDLGRADGLRRLQADPFNCAGLYSDADLEECTALRFLKTTGDTIEGAHKTPTLRNVAATAPYMHTGQFPDLRSVLEHYSDGGLALVGHNELEPLDLTATEMEQLEAFLHTLTQE